MTDDINHGDQDRGASVSTHSESRASRESSYEALLNQAREAAVSKKHDRVAESADPIPKRRKQGSDG